MVRNWSLLVLLVAFISACNTPVAEENNVPETIDPQDAYKRFRQNFGAVTLPYPIPNPEASSKKIEIDRATVESLFNKKSFKPAFDAKDVPDLAENIQSANYFYDGMWQTDGYQAYIVQKSDEEEYWYLSTFNMEGQFIDGMCIAFQIGDETGKTERRALINDDHSILIRQFEGAEGTGANGPAQLFEIAEDGRIVPMQNGNTQVQQPV